MSHLLNKLYEIVNIGLNVRSRVLVALAAIMLLPTFFLPIWRLHLWSYQYPEGLDLYIHTHQLTSGNDNADLMEINILNHYIGMHEINEDDFVELDWIPFVLGALILLSLRAAVLGRMSKLVDVLVLSTYFGAFSLWSFYYKLYSYGHNLDPKAAVQIEPFSPPIFGLRDLAQFKVWSYPDFGTVFIVLFVVVLILAILASAVPFIKSQNVETS
jgi:hypothetical protein